MKDLKIVGMISFITVILSGCQTVSETVQGPAEAAGGVLAAPQAVTQGINSGYTNQTGSNQANPYGR